MLAFSFTGRLDPLDWVVLLGRLSAQLLLPPLFLHFALVFPDRPDAWVRSDTGRTLLPALVSAGAAARRRLGRGRRQRRAPRRRARRVAELVQNAALVYLAVSLVAGLAIMIRALAPRAVGDGASSASLDRLGHRARVAAVRLRLRAAVRPGLQPLRGFELSALLIGLIPLAFASAIVRYRLMDVEVIIKRGLVYAAAVVAIAAIYSILLKLASVVFLKDADQRNPVIALLATLVVVLLSRPVKDAIQSALDRVYYRDRYDYRRALVGFARDLNSDLDLLRLSERLVHRVTETLLVDRMALMLAPVLGLVRRWRFRDDCARRLSRCAAASDS